MIEKVRAVIADAMHAGAAMMGQSTEMHEEALDRYTRAIFAAMREPTKEMIDAAWDAKGTLDEDADEYHDLVWRAMIDAALEEVS